MSTSIQKNWSGIVQFKPQKIHKPHTEPEIIAAIQQCALKKQKMRIIGSGYSCSPLVETEYELMSLNNYQGIVNIDHSKMQATVYAGTKIELLNQLLFEEGLALENTGSLDRQTIAGAISTGAHGTGLQFGILATQVIGLSLVTASGQVLNCSANHNPEIFKASQVSLGTLGVISTLTLQCVPAYQLNYSSDKEDLSSCLVNLDTYNANTRNFEFCWFPYSKISQTKFSNITNSPIEDPPLLNNFISPEALGNGILSASSKITGLLPGLLGSIAKLSSKLPARFTKNNWSHLVNAGYKGVKYNEMEYNIPIGQFKDTLLEVVDCFEHYRFQVHLPLSNRFVKADDIYLSPAFGRDSACISLPVYKGKDYHTYFEVIESVCRNHNGRPHWGKIHSLTATDLQLLYPKWNQFLQIRKQLDPKGMFLNGYLRQLLGIESLLES